MGKEEGHAISGEDLEQTDGDSKNIKKLEVKNYYPDISSKLPNVRHENGMRVNQSPGSTEKYKKITLRGDYHSSPTI